jgi:DHA2 family multidrug resistance protein
MRHRDSAIVPIPLDKIGLAFMVVGIGCLQLMLEVGHDYDWFASPFIATLGIVALVSLTFFIAWAIMTEHPIVDVHLMRDPNFRYGVILLSVGFMTYFGSVVIFPLWLQTVMGYTAAQAGMATAPIGVFTLLLSPIIGRNIGKLDLRILATFAFAVMGAVSVWNSMMNLDVTFWNVVSPRLVQGIGMACFFLPVQALMLSNITPDNMAAASGLSNFLRTLGAAIGTAISVTSWEYLSSMNRASLVENVNCLQSGETRLIWTNCKPTGMSNEQAYAVIDHVLCFRRAIWLPPMNSFMYSAVLFFLLMGVVWLTKPRKGTGGAMGH